MVPLRSASSDRLRKPAIPAFSLYGEEVAAGIEGLHIEELRARSSLYQWEISPHIHKGLYQLLWVPQGVVEVLLDARTQSVQGPVVVVVPPGLVHGFKFAPDTDGLVLTLSPRLLLEAEFQATGEAFCSQFELGALLPLDDEAALATRLGALLRTLLGEFHTPGAAEAPVALWLARSVLWLLTQLQPAHNEPRADRSLRQRRLFTRFLQLVETQLREQWTLSRYAARLGLSTQRLNRLARAVSGHSALEVVHERLAREACRRLVYTEAPVGTIAQELGFSDAAYFARFFRRRLRMSPVDYRARRESRFQTPAA